MNVLHLSIFIDMKICSECRNSKPLEEFSKSSRSKDRKQNRCKVCEKEQNRLAREKHPTSKYYNQNKDYYKDYSKQWISENKERWVLYYNDWQRKYSQEKYNTDPGYRLRICLNSRIRAGLKSKKTHKNNRTVILIGCDFVFLKIYIEQFFRNGMLWENHGKVWELDHILPISSFDLSKIEEQKKCFHYTNLQPLFKTTKIAKSFNSDEIGNKEKSNKILN